MNNRNTVRMKVRIAIYRKHKDLFESYCKIDPKLRWSSKEGERIIEIFRTRLGYSKSTYAIDILHTAYCGYIRWQETGNPIYKKSLGHGKSQSKIQR